MWLVFCLVFTAYAAVEVWSGSAKWWSYLVLGLMATVMQVAELLGRRWARNAVIQRVVWVLLAAAMLVAFLLDVFFWP
jgi:hypothetical protein